MNFQTLEQVFSSDYYLNTALNRTKNIQSKASRSKSKEQKKAILEREKLKSIKDTLSKKLNKIVKDFPSFDGMPEFYNELSKTNFDLDDAKKSLSNIKWTANKINELQRVYDDKIRRDNEKTLFFKKEFIGRTSSLMKKIDSDLSNLEGIRRKLLAFPDIKENMFTVCLAGFPNVGKSTLLSKITTANPKIANYSFTTKTLNLGYYKYRFEKIQIIDSPGTLARYDKMNDIEKQAYLAIKYVANLIVFIYDLTGEYSIDDQDKLLDIIKLTKKPIIFYLSKTDILDKKIINDFLKTRKQEFVVDVDLLVEIVNKAKKNY